MKMKEIESRVGASLATMAMLNRSIVMFFGNIKLEQRQVQQECIQVGCVPAAH